MALSVNCIRREVFQFSSFPRDFPRDFPRNLCGLENNIQSVSRSVLNDVEIFKTSSFTEVICCKTGKKMLTLKPIQK